MLNAVAPHVVPVARYLRSLRKQRKRHAHCVTQQELNELYFGPRFHISNRYASNMNVVSLPLLGSLVPALDCS